MNTRSQTESAKKKMDEEINRPGGSKHPDSDSHKANPPRKGLDPEETARIQQEQARLLAEEKDKGQKEPTPAKSGGQGAETGQAKLSPTDIVVDAVTKMMHQQMMSLNDSIGTISRDVNKLENKLSQKLETLVAEINKRVADLEKQLTSLKKEVEGRLKNMKEFEIRLRAEMSQQIARCFEQYDKRPLREANDQINEATLPNNVNEVEKVGPQNHMRGLLDNIEAGNSSYMPGQAGRMPQSSNTANGDDPSSHHSDSDDGNRSGQSRKDDYLRRRRNYCNNGDDSDSQDDNRYRPNSFGCNRNKSFRPSAIDMNQTLKGSAEHDFSRNRAVTNQSNQVLKRLYNRYLDVKPWDLYADHRNAARMLHQWRKNVQPYCESIGDEINSFCALMRGTAARWAEKPSNQVLNTTELTKKFLSHFYPNEVQLNEIRMFLNSEYPQMNGETVADFISFWWDKLEFNKHTNPTDFLDAVRQRVPESYANLIHLWMYNQIGVDGIIELLDKQAATAAASKMPSKAPASWLEAYTGKPYTYPEQESTEKAQSSETPYKRRFRLFNKAKKETTPEVKVFDDENEIILEEMASDGYETATMQDKNEDEYENELIAVAEKIVQARRSKKGNKSSGNASRLMTRAQPSTPSSIIKESPPPESKIDENLKPAMWQGYQVIGDSHMQRFVNYQNGEKEIYKLCKPGYRLNDLIKDLQNQPKLESDMIIIHIGGNDVKSTGFAADVWRFKFKGLLKLIKTQNPQLKKMLIFNISPALDQPTEYWRRLEEINSAIWLESRNYKDIARVFNIFRKFTQKKTNPEFKEVKEWKYVKGDKIVYNPRLALYQRVTKDGKPDKLHWNESGISAVEYGLKQYVKAVKAIETRPKPTAEVIEPVSESETEDDEVLDMKELVELESEHDSPDEAELAEAMASRDEMAYAEISVLSPDIENDETVKQAVAKLQRIDGRPEISLEIGDEHEKALVDSGASHVLIEEQKFEELCNRDKDIISTIIPCRGSGKTFQQAAGKAKIKPVSTAVMKFRFEAVDNENNLLCETPVTVIKGLNAKIILGRSFLDDFTVDIQHPRRQIEISFPGCTERVTIPYLCKMTTEINYTELEALSPSQWYADTAISHARVVPDGQCEIQMITAISENFRQSLGGCC